MTSEEQRILIAKACGWKVIEERTVIAPGTGCYYRKGWFSPEMKAFDNPPDYLNDLNAAIPLLGDDYDISCRNGIITVTIYIPSQEFDSRGESADLPKAICEAFLRKVGKWI